MNTFSGQKALLEQATDMLRFRHLGTQVFEQYITHHLLNQPSSTKAPVRCKLLTMAPVKRSKRGISQKEKELWQVAKCLRRRLAWCNHTKLPFDTTHEQYSIFPRALADEEGNPHKSAKSNWTDKLQSQYLTAKPPVVRSFYTTTRMAPPDGYSRCNVSDQYQASSKDQNTSKLRSTDF